MIFRGKGSWGVWGLLTVGLVALPVMAQPQGQELNFISALHRLEQFNETLEAERHVLGQAQAQLGEASGRRWPELGLSGGYAYIDDPIHIDMGPVRQALGQVAPGLPSRYLPPDIRVRDQHFGTVSASLRWPLYTGGRITAGIDAAEAAVAAGQAQLDGVEGSLRLQLVERYFAQVLARETVAVRENSVDTLERHYHQANRLQQEGQIARAEVLRAEVALSEARRDRDTAQHTYQLTQAALAALLASERSFTTTTDLPVLPSLPPLAPLVEAALQDNPSLKAAREQRQRAEAGVRAAQGEELPTVALMGQHNIYNELELIDPDWVVGMVVTWTAFDGGVTRHRVREAQLKASEVAQRLQAGSRDTVLLVRQRHNALADAITQVDSYHTTHALATESLRAQQRAFEEGVASSLDVVDAELALQRVALGILSARYDGIVAMAGLLDVTGQTQRIGELLVGGNL